MIKGTVMINGGRDLIVSLPGTEELGSRISNLLRCEHVIPYTKVFPDGESYLRLEGDFEGEEVTLLSTMYPEQNRRLVELVFASKTLVERGASKVRGVVTYLAYARQDKEFLPGEVVSARIVIDMLKYAGIGELYVVDVHKPEILNGFGGPSRNILMVETFASFLRSRGVDNPLIVAPDLGASHRAEALAKEIGGECVIIRKFRDRVTGEIRHELPEGFHIDGRTAVVIDDIISTGGTMASIVSFLKRSGARRVYALASHGVFVGNAVERLISGGADEVAVLDTLSRRVEGVTYLDISNELSKHLSNC